MRESLTCGGFRLHDRRWSIFRPSDQNGLTRATRFIMIFWTDRKASR